MSNANVSSSVWSKFGMVTVGAMALGLVGFSAGCSSTASDGGDESATGNDSAALSRADAVERADQWANAQLKYCQSAYHARDYDTSCSEYCDRESNAAWNPYRSDCSGLISWAWGLPAPGRVTGEFAPYDTAVSHTIPAEALQPGDACNSSDHIIMFKEWIVPRESARFIEEPGCSSSTPYAHEFTSDVSVSGDSIYVAYEGKSFTSIRYNNVTGEGGGSTDPNPPAKPPAQCHSDTLGKNVPNNVCVQSDSDDQWYQCDGGNWVSRTTDPKGCSALYPLKTARDCYSDTLEREMPDDACVQSRTNKLWYQCAGGAWVDRWTDPQACDGVHPL